MALTTKLGVALLIAFASGATLLSLVPTQNVVRRDRSADTDTTNVAAQAAADAEDGVPAMSAPEKERDEMFKDTPKPTPTPRPPRVAKPGPGSPNVNRTSRGNHSSEAGQLQGKPPPRRRPQDGKRGPARPRKRPGEEPPAEDGFSLDEARRRGDIKVEQLYDDPPSNSTNIAVKATTIAINLTSVAINNASIDINRTNIHINTTNVATNTTNVAINTTIATNTTNVAISTTNAVNTTNVDINSTNIHINTTIATNTTNVAINSLTDGINTTNVDINSPTNVINTNNVALDTTNVAMNNTPNTTKVRVGASAEQMSDVSSITTTTPPAHNLTKTRVGNEGIGLKVYKVPTIKNTTTTPTTPAITSKPRTTTKKGQRYEASNTPTPAPTTIVSTSKPRTSNKAATNITASAPTTRRRVEQVNKSPPTTSPTTTTTSRPAMKTRMDTGHHLADVIASLTEAELGKLPSSTAKILVPALVALESVVLKELERLHDLAIHQDLRLEILEKRQLQENEILEAANVIREEQYLRQRQEQKEALQQQEGHRTTAKSLSSSRVETINADQRAAGDILHLEKVSLNDDDSGSGDESPSLAVGTSVTTPTATTAVANRTQSSDSVLINHIYEIYSSITSMEHKVMELGTSLAQVSAEVYRQRTGLVRLEDRAEDFRRDQRNLAMRTAMHGFKITDMEQFKGQAELTLRTAETSLEQFQTKLEVFKDRVTQQQDELEAMRNTFGRLEQASSELRATDAYKAHDIQELKRAAQQLEGRLGGLYHSLDQYTGNLKWDMKNYLDHLCTNNNLKCR